MTKKKEAKKADKKTTKKEKAPKVEEQKVEEVTTEEVKEPVEVEEAPVLDLTKYHRMVELGHSPVSVLRAWVRDAHEGTHADAKTLYQKHEKEIKEDGILSVLPKL